MAAKHVDLADARAVWALERVKAWTRPREAVQLVKGLPVSLRALGLAQGVAMLARGGGVGRELADDLSGWLLEKAPHRSLDAGRSGARADALGLVERVLSSSQAAVRAAEEEAIRFLEVLKLLGELVHG